MKIKLTRSASLFLAILLLMLCGCQKSKPTESEEEKAMKIKINYAINLRFNGTGGNYGITIGETFFNKELGYTECVFVLSEEDAKGYADNVFVCWPSEGTDVIIDRINRQNEINRLSNKEEVDFTQFSLENPITVSDVVEKWESVRELLYAFDSSARDSILNGYL